MPIFREPSALASYLATTGQENDPPELVNARQTALATTGMFADCTPTMAYHLAIGDIEALVNARRERDLGLPGRRPKRAAAQNASAAWAELSPRKRQRR